MVPDLPDVAVTLLSPFAHAGAAALLAWIANYVGLIPWRRAAEAHWTERARRFWPARITAAGNILVLPLILDQIHRLIMPESIPLMLVNGSATCAGALLGSYPFEHEVYPELDFRTWLHQASAVWGFRLSFYLALIVTGILMPEEFGWPMIGLVSAYLLVHFAIQFGFLLKYLRWVNFLQPADERLKRVVLHAAEGQGPIPRATWEIKGFHAQAYAFPTTRELVFSTRLLQVCTDDELSAICTHELAHLAESKWVLAGRLLGSLTLFPLVFIKPLIHALDFGGLLAAYLGMVLLLLFTRRLAQKMEKRADKLAVGSQLNEGLYARALEKLYRENQLPAVNINNRQTHPHLYDRLVAAGLTPDYPRPPRPNRFTWIGFAFWCAFGVLLGLQLARM